MTRLYWYLRGYVQFVFTGGFAEDFINALGELGITLPGLQRQGSDLRGVCSVGTYMQLHKAARQAGGRVRITARRGLPFFLRRLRGRWGLPMGAVAFALVLCVLSGFIWDVQVVGNNRVGTGNTGDLFGANGVAVGKPWQGTGAQSAELSTAAGFSGSGLGAYQQGGRHRPAGGGRAGRYP